MFFEHDHTEVRWGWLVMTTRRRRSQVGTNNPRAKLTEADVQDIKALLAKGKESLSSIGRRYDVNRMTIANIRDGKSWSHL